MRYLLIFTFIFALGAYADEPTTVVRHRGKAGVAERIESRGKGAKENVVHVRVGRIIDGVVVQDRIVVKGADVFDAKPKTERKAEKRDRPQPASVEKVKRVKVGR